MYAEKQAAKMDEQQNKPLAPRNCMVDLCTMRRSSYQLFPHRYLESQQCNLAFVSRMYKAQLAAKEPAPSSMASVTSAIVKSAIVIG